MHEDPRPSRVPLFARILIGVALGLLAAWALGPRVAPLGDVGMLVIRMLKALATPLVLFAVLDAFLRTRIPGRKGRKLVAIGLLNAGVAVVIGLLVANVIRGGIRWRGRLEEVVHLLGVPAVSAGRATETTPTLSPLANLTHLVPESLVEPFAKNAVIGVVLVAVLFGIALRKLKDHGGEEARAGITVIESFVRVAFGACVIVLEWLVQAVPFAVFGIVASVASKTGLRVFGALGTFLGTAVLGLFLQAFVWYAILLRVAGGASPWKFYRGAADAIVTALSCGSSLATLPVTLRCLEKKLKVSHDSARLAACVGTNLNHDGIILYEAGAALFVAQAVGIDLTLGQQLSVALASVMAGVGIAGVPEAGLITLPLVLGAANLPEPIVATIVPLLLPVDWIIGRCRATTNVLSDMTVAVLLDRGEPAVDESALAARNAAAP